MPLTSTLFPAGPWPWQTRLAAEVCCRNQLIRIPTGFGKTLGVLHAWLRAHFDPDGHERWPTRLVWCLPMRVLAEQTSAEIRRVLADAGLADQVDVHLLMGGVEATDWALFPERRAVLVGTQDMLLSRALNRGYAAARARWPMEFGLLSQDCLWVMDEVQLMDVGLATSAQLQAFWQEDAQAGRAIWPNRTWWMSATLQPDWLAGSPDTTRLTATLAHESIPIVEQTGPLWDDVAKPLRRIDVKDAKEIARAAADQHLAADQRGLTLVICNTVRRAVDVHAELQRQRGLQGCELRLVHSRFRPHEREQWRAQFLNRAACAGEVNRIIVTTQVIEAGVDISADRLLTELAPWPSLVQRFGRCARWGGRAAVTVCDLHLDGKAALPYSSDELEAARESLAILSDVAPLSLEAFEAQLTREQRQRLYPYNPLHLLLRREIDELFDTAPDLSGADTDVSRFIRSGDERDVQLFWVDLPTKQDPDARLRPHRDALCAAPIGDVAKWLLDGNKLKKGTRAYALDYLDGDWKPIDRSRLVPGTVLLVAADAGGYDPSRGFSPESKAPVLPVPLPESLRTEALDADQREESEALSVASYQTIAGHGWQVGELAAAIARTLAPSVADLLHLAGRGHDVGKVHLAFGACIQQDHPGRPARNDLAKAPAAAWVPRADLYRISEREQRRGFRHELASTLALFAILQRHAPTHPALLGEWAEWLAAADLTLPADAESTAPPTAIESEVLALSAEQFDLLAYLVCSHHGKVRVSWHASPYDQRYARDRLRIRGVEEGDVLPVLAMYDRDHHATELPASPLCLDPSALGLSPRTGRSWSERVLALRQRLGPFQLAYLEALLRAADQRASRQPDPDPLLELRS